MPDRRNRRSLMMMAPERLDARLAPSSITFVHVPTPGGAMHDAAPPKVPSYKPTGTTMDKAGQILNIIYNEYQAYQIDGDHGLFASSQSGRVQITGTSVGVAVRAKGDITALSAQLKAQGMTITATAPQFGIIEGTLPIGRLPTVAADGSVIGIDPVSRPTFNRSF